MVRESDNEAAITLHRELGPKPMMELARRAGMRDFSDKGSWSESTVTAADQARFFASLDALVKPRHLDYARSLLVTIVEGQGWGVPKAARGWRVLFKGGWRPAGRTSSSTRAPASSGARAPSQSQCSATATRTSPTARGPSRVWRGACWRLCRARRWRLDPLRRRPS